MSTNNRPTFVSKSDYLDLVSRVFQSQMKNDSHDPWHVEDLATYLDLTVESITHMLTALDEMGFRYANNGNR